MFDLISLNFENFSPATLTMSENESENTNVFSEFLYDIGDFFSGNDVMFFYLLSH